MWSHNPITCNTQQQDSLHAGVSSGTLRGSHTVHPRRPVNVCPGMGECHPVFTVQPSLPPLHFVSSDLGMCRKGLGQGRGHCLPSLCCGRSILRDTFSGPCSPPYFPCHSAASLPAFIMIRHNLPWLSSFSTLSGLSSRGQDLIPLASL